ncbi:MAG TPA: heme-binding protein [Kofleriaceae bacterium]|jgi:hypothetical protein|nr:heme-binding protein [Kofleriaceae bacterium]
MKISKLAWYSLAAVPVGVGVLVGRRSKLAGAVAGGLTALGVGALRWQLARLFTEEPDFQLESRIGDLEIRRYAAHVTAHTDLELDDYDKAVRRGFKKLASYIFGDNFAPTSAKPEKLAMTSPVIAAENARGFRMSFVMPKGRDVASLPTPNDSEVELDQLPERRVAVLRFHGRYNAETVHQRERELMKLVEQAGLEPASAPMFAGFDAPSTAPFLRRNEVWVELA